MKILKTVQFRYGTDNLGYLIHGDTDALAIDGGACKEMMDYLSSRKLRLKYVTNTHSHGDHTCGNSSLLKLSGAEFIDVKDLPELKKIDLEGNSIRVYHTPGHTTDSVCFYYEGVLIAGDTLFNGKVGRCFTGDIPGFFQSIKQILDLPPDTVLFAGHDYVFEYLDQAGELEPENLLVDEYRSLYNPNLVCATLREEMEVDPFIRYNKPEIIRMLVSRGLPVDTEFHRFRSVMSLM